MSFIIDAINQFFGWFAKLVYLNILWIGFSLLGGLVLGLAPATMAMFAVSRNWTRGEQEFPLFALFWKKYREEFWAANAVGWLWAAAFGILAADWQAIVAHVQVAPYLTMSIFYAGVIACLVGVIYTGPVFSRYQLSSLSVIYYALWIGFTHPIRTIGMIAGIAGIVVLSSFLPVLGVAMGASSAVYFVSVIAKKTLPEPIMKK